MRAIACLLVLAVSRPAPAQPAAGAVRVVTSAELAPLWSRWGQAFGRARVEVASPRAGAPRSPPGPGELGSTLGAPADEKAVAIPVGVSAAAIVYDVLIPGDLRLSRDVLAAIYGGTIRSWRDPAILALNPGAVFPDLPIRVASGGTAECEGALRGFIGEAAARAPLRLEGAAKLAAWVKATEGSLACLDASYARREGLFLASVANRAGNFVQPEAHSVTRAAAGVRYGRDLRATLSQAQGADSYPLSLLLYAVLPAALSPEAEELVGWILRDGQRQLVPMGAAPLPGLVVLQAEERLRASSPRGRASP